MSVPPGAISVFNSDSALRGDLRPKWSALPTADDAGATSPYWPSPDVDWPPKSPKQTSGVPQTPTFPIAPQNPVVRPKLTPQHRPNFAEHPFSSNNTERLGPASIGSLRTPELAAGQAAIAVPALRILAAHSGMPSGHGDQTSLPLAVP